MNQDSANQAGSATGSQEAIRPAGLAGSRQAGSTASPRSQAGSQDSPRTGAIAPASSAAGSAQPDSGHAPAPGQKEIAAAFKAVFGDVTASRRQAEKLSVAKRLAPYRKAVLALRAAGLSWKKIAAGMHDPRIGVRVSPETLKTVFGEADSGPQKVEGESRKAEAAI